MFSTVASTSLDTWAWCVVFSNLFTDTQGICGVHKVLWLWMMGQAWCSRLLQFHRFWVCWHVVTYYQYYFILFLHFHWCWMWGNSDVAWYTAICARWAVGSPGWGMEYLHIVHILFVQWLSFLSWTKFSPIVFQMNLKISCTHAYVTWSRFF